MILDTLNSGLSVSEVGKRINVAELTLDRHSADKRRGYYNSHHFGVTKNSRGERRTRHFHPEEGDSSFQRYHVTLRLSQPHFFPFQLHLHSNQRVKASRVIPSPPLYPRVFRILRNRGKPPLVLARESNP